LLFADGQVEEAIKAMQQAAEIIQKKNPIGNCWRNTRQLYLKNRIIYFLGEDGEYNL
jgi:hypothetical protein